MFNIKNTYLAIQNNFRIAIQQNLNYHFTKIISIDLVSHVTI
jgi:hypothetical protein